MRKRWIADLFVHKRWYRLLGGGIVLFLLAFFFDFIFYVAGVYTLALLVLTLLDYVLLFGGSRKVAAQRIIAERLNLGAQNTVRISVANPFPFKTGFAVIDEVPIEFQERDFGLWGNVGAGRRKVLAYQLRPLRRGAYQFGDIICYVNSPLCLLQRRCTSEAGQEVKVYPSSQWLRQYQLMALSDSNQFVGTRRIRRLGNSTEFEQIKEYVSGDDVRTINWKATARRGSPMVNNYVDARSQQIYCVIDRGRNMKMPFDGLTLLDYSINAALIFLHIALLKQDRAGLIAFDAKVGDLLPAERTNMQMNKLNEALYRQQTNFGDSDFAALHHAVFRKLSQRSFLLLFTNFETYAALERQLPYLRQLAARHLLCVVFFQNTLLKQIREGYADTLEGIYIKTIADRFDFEKKQIVKELRRYGILSVLTTPQNLTVDVINKYLELKARQMV
ncbi:MAG: DUF58 domain-containing protein [Edaphocola sp.]